MGGKKVKRERALIKLLRLQSVKGRTKVKDISEQLPFLKKMLSCKIGRGRFVFGETSVTTLPNPHDPLILTLILFAPVYVEHRACTSTVLPQ